MRLSEPTTKIRLNIDPYCQRQNCTPITRYFLGYKVYADIRGGSLERERQTPGWLLRRAIFTVFAGYFSGKFRDEARVIMLRYAVRRHLFSDLKMHDLE